MKRIYLLLFVFVLIYSGCTSSQADTLSVPSQWRLESFGKAGAETPTIEDSTITLEFEADNRVGGSGGCNSYGGTYQKDGNSLTIKDIMSTMMACADERVMGQEQQFFSALQSATQVEISGDKLIILYENEQSKLIFVKQ